MLLNSQLNLDCMLPTPFPFSTSTAALTTNPKDKIHMYNPIQLTNTIATVRPSIGRSPLRAFLLIPFVVACFALSPLARAVTPAPDGGYPNQNTAEGEDALFSLTRGINNIAVGFSALYNNTKGYDNTAIGYGALNGNISGFLNTACGFQALYFNTTGKRNTANGVNALYANTSGNNNTACGYLALASNTTGINNIGLGLDAGSAIITGSNNIDIGNVGVEGDFKTIRLGDSHHTNTYIAGINGVTVAGGVGVIVDSSGHLGTVVSSKRFKDAIKPMDKASKAIFSLQPVAFRYKHELDPDGIPQFGLVAEDVEKVNPDLVARDDHGKPYTVRYEAVNAMLLNEFLKEHRKVQEQETAITKLKSTVAQQQKESRSTAAQQENEIKALAATAKEQAAQIQKVSAQLEASKPAPRLVNNQ